jgi:hypothetical protein
MSEDTSKQLQQQSVSEPTEPKLQVSDETFNDEDFILEFIQMTLPKNIMNKAKALYSFVKQNASNLISWDQSGRIKIRDRIIPNTHIVDLIKYNVSPLSKNQPEGSEEFYSVLQEINTPKSLICEFI